AFVEILPGRDGLVHISELSTGYVNSVGDVCRIGDEMKVLVIDVDEHDRVKLSRKRAHEELGIVDEMAAQTTERQPPREAGGDGGGGGGGGGYRGGRGGGGRGGDRGGRGGRGGGGGGGGGGRGGYRDRDRR